MLDRALPQYIPPLLSSSELVFFSFKLSSKFLSKMASVQQPGRGSACVLIVVRVLCAALLLQCALAATYTVGDDKGWDLGVNYATWAAKNTFKAGDVLVFTYSAMHSVLEVNQADYTACTLNNAINTLTTGNDSITLSSTKTTQFFICGTPGHCSGGMALQVTISSSSVSPPAAAPAKSPSKSPAKAPSKAPPPKPLPSSPPGATPAPDSAQSGAGVAQSPPASTTSPPPSSEVPPPPPGNNSAASSSFSSSFASSFAGAALALAAAAALF